MILTSNEINYPGPCTSEHTQYNILRNTCSLTHSLRLSAQVNGAGRAWGM